MNGQEMLKALKCLDKEVPEPFNLLIGGGAAFILAHQIPLSTMDIDGIPFRSKISPADIDPYVKKVAVALNLPHDWLNTYFATFTYSLPRDYGERLVPVFKGEKIDAFALSKEDLLIMKSFASRDKDILHVRSLIKKGVDLKWVRDHLHHSLKENLPRAQEACDFFYDLCEQLGMDV